MVDQLYWLISLLLGLFALVMALYVLRNIFWEAVERQRSQSGETSTASDRPDGGDEVVCSNCQAKNDPEYEYCSECATIL